MPAILHTSDLHGNLDALFQALALDFDIWVDSGDFFPNKTRGNRHVECVYQAKWLHENQVISRIRQALAGRPMVSVQGNHDYTSLAGWLDCAQGYEVGSQMNTVNVCGLIFAGFREIPYIIGEWNGEASDAQLRDKVDLVFNLEPDVLITHAPPAGILDDGLGITSLTSALMYREHSIKAHLFGHIHPEGRRTRTENSILFSNAACGYNLLRVQHA